MQLTTLLIPTFTHMLKSFAGWLDKASAHEQAAGRDANALMTQRLAPDMYPLNAQVRFACFQALEPMFRLRGLAVPDAVLRIRDEGWQSHESQGSFAEAQTHIADALVFLSSLSADEIAAIDAAADQAIALDMSNGIIFDMTGEQYARDWSLAQFYFHTTTGYAILRHHGVPLGKPDYVSHVGAYIRSGTMPKQ